MEGAAALDPDVDGLFETWFRHSPDVIVILDARTGVILDASLAVRRYLGYEPEHLIGTHVDRILPAPREVSSLVVDDVWLHGAAFGERDVARIDGSTSCMLMRAALRLLSSHQVVILTLHDITARKRTELAVAEAERRYRGIFENAIEGIFQTTANGHYISANPALARIYGYDSPEALISDLTDIAGQLYVDKNRRAEFQRALQERDEVRDFESEVYRCDRSRIWISENARAVRDRTGHLLYYEGTVVDISVRRRTQEEQARAVRELEHASRLKTEFIATISHELRTPLNIILGYTELLGDGTFGSLVPEQVDVVERVRQTGLELRELIEATLDLSRLDAGAVAVEPQSVDVNALLGELAETHAGQPKDGVALVWQIAPDLPPLTTDPGKLKLVLKNLISNAVKFTEAGVVTVGVTADATGHVFDVCDTGIGIPREAHQLIFEPFRQVDGSDARRFGGVGLGLHIVKRVLALLRGAIEVHSELGMGSTFRVRLPQLQT